MRKETGKQVSKTDNRPLSGNLIGDIRRFIETARQNVAVTVNAGLTILYWQIDSRIRQDILKEKRAEYGREIVVTLSRQLVKEFGNGFSRPNLFREGIGGQYTYYCLFYSGNRYTVSGITLYA